MNLKKKTRKAVEAAGEGITHPGAQLMRAKAIAQMVRLESGEPIS